MAGKDILERSLESFEDVFADIVNVLLLPQGARVEPNELEDVGSRSLYTSSGEVREQERDVAKLWRKGGAVLCLLGLENQSQVDRFMPVRTLGYEGGDYRYQLAQRRGAIRAAEAAGDEAEAKRLREAKLYPIITLVLYFGTKARWRYPRSLLECLDVPEALRGLVEDRHIHVVELAWLNEEQERRFTSDFRFVVEFLRQKRLRGEYTPSSPQAMRHVDTLLKLMRELSGDDRFTEVQEQLQENLNRGEEVTMMDVFGKVMAQGRAEGLTQGLTQGLSQGLAQGRAEGLEAAAAYLRDNGMTPEQIARFRAAVLERLV